MVNRKLHTYRFTSCSIRPSSIGLTNIIIIILNSIFHGKQNATNLQVDIV